MTDKNKRVNPKELKGKDKKDRTIQLMEELDPKQNKELPTSNVELIKKGPDNKIYAIVRENKRYYIKRGENNTEDENGTPIISESNLKYIGNLANKTKHSHPSYSKALKSMNMMFSEIFESEGRKNDITDPSVSDKVIISEDDSNAVDRGEDEEESDSEPTVLYDEELSDEEEEIDEILKNGGEKPVKKESKKPEFSLKEAILKEEDQEGASNYDEYVSKMAKKHFDAETDEELGSALKNASSEEAQSFFSDLDKWTSDEEEKYMTEEDQKNNPYAICNAQANEDGGWSDEKIERCVKDVKKQNESRKPGKKKAIAEEDEGGKKSKGEGEGKYDAHSDPDSYFNKEVEWIKQHQPEWDEVKGVKVLRIKDSRYVAAPKTGKKNAKNFAIIDLKEEEVIAHLDKKEVTGWLVSNYKIELEDESKNESRKPGKKKVAEAEGDEYEEDKRYVLKNPSADEDGDVGEIETDGLEDIDLDDEEGGDEEGGEEEGGGDEPFDDEPFDPGVEADEDEDPEKFIQQLAGKLSTSLRNYNKEEAEPDTDLEQYAINMLLDAAHTEEFSDEEQQEIIDSVKGEGDSEDEEGGDEEDMGDEEGDIEGLGDEEEDEDEESIDDKLDTDLKGDEEDEEKEEK